MRLMLVPMTLLLFALTGCATGPFDAPPGAEFSDVDDLQIPWFGCLIDIQTGLPNPNCRNSDPVVFPLSVWVTDSVSTLPINNVRVTFTSFWSGIYVMPQSVIEAVSLPETEGWSTLSGGGEVFAEFSGEYEGGYEPTYHDTWTDSTGRARTWVVIETMPQDATGMVTQSGILVDMGVESFVVNLQASN